MSAPCVFNSTPDLAHDAQPVAAPDLGDILLLIATGKQGPGQVEKRVCLLFPLSATAIYINL